MNHNFIYLWAALIFSILVFVLTDVPRSMGANTGGANTGGADAGGADHGPGDAGDQALVGRLEALEDFLGKNPNDFRALKEAGILSSNLARKDPKGYAPQAVDLLTRAHEIDKLDDETLCYLGSAVSLLARTTINPFKKSAYVNRGCGYMDKAVRRSPDNITVRMTRGSNSMSLPGFLNRRSFAYEDFEYLARRFEKEPHLPAGLKKTVYSNLAELYSQDGKTDKAEHYRTLSSNQQERR